MNTAETLLLRVGTLAQEAYRYKNRGRNDSVIRIIANINQLLEKIVVLTRKEMEK